jgi:predicted DNA-binding ArsR family transcriptional regulator
MKSPMPAAVEDRPDSSSEQARRIDAEHSMEELLNVLGDADCRAILDATSDGALSAKEVSETCELPISTTYRKLDLLTDVGLLEERTRIRYSGKHISEYCRSVTDVVVSIDANGNMELEVSHRDSSERAERSLPVIGD